MSFTQTNRERHERDHWVLLSLIPLGLGAWAPIVPGMRYRNGWWTALGVFWTAVTVLGFVLSGNERAGHASAAGGVVLLAWVGGAVSSFAIRSQRRRRGPAPIGEAGTVARRARKVHRNRWPWVSMIPFGFGSWAPLIAAVRCGVWWWALPGFAGAGTCIAGCVLLVAAAAPGAMDPNEAAVGVLLLIGSWVGGIAASFAIRPAYDARSGLPPQRRAPWPQPTARSLQWSARYAIAAFSLTFAAVIALGLVLSDVVDVSVNVGVGVLMVDAILLTGLVPLARNRGLSLADLGVRPTPALRSMPLVILAFLTYVILAALWALVFIGHSTRHAATELSQAQSTSTLDVLITVVAISASAPIVEELFFRGLLYRSLRNRLPMYQAAILAGLLFGLVHITGYPLITLPVKALFGVLACLLYERSGSLLPGIALHSFVDGSVIDLSLTGNDNVVLIVAGSIASVLVLRAGAKRLMRAAIATS